MQIAACAPHDLMERQSAVVSFLHVVPGGVTLDQALAETYWRNAWKLLEHKRNSTIDLLADDGAWEATVRVVSSGGPHVRFRVLSRWAAPKPQQVPAGYAVQHLPREGWRVLAPDKSVLASGEPGEHEAVEAAVAHARRFAPPPAQAQPTQPQTKKTA